MPTEPYSWDRRDFRKQHDRSGDPPRFGGGGPPHRWREQQQQQQNPHVPPPYYHHHQQNRWYSDYRPSRPIPPPGHGKQGGWHMYPEEGGNGFSPFGSRYGDRNGEEDGCRPFHSRGEGRYIRNNNNNNNYRENRGGGGSFSQRETKAPSSEPATSQKGHVGPVPDVVNSQKSVEINNNNNNAQRSNSNDNNNGDGSSHPLPNSASPADQSQSLAKEKHEVNTGTTDGPTGSGQKPEKEDSLGSIDWKPLKWNRSCSLSSRSSSFSHSGSSKSMGVDSVEMVVNVQEKNVTPMQSPPAAAAVAPPPAAVAPPAAAAVAPPPAAVAPPPLAAVAPSPPAVVAPPLSVALPPPAASPSTPAVCVKTASAVTRASPDESGSRKKPRLGWGEGLAKYEKKKVGPEDGANESGLVISCDTESLPSHFVDKSPRPISFTDCASPATPSSVACSSSPGIDEKESVKAANIDHSTTNLSCSPSIMSNPQYDGPPFNLESLDSASIANLRRLINELLEPEDSSSVETGYVRTTSMNKLLVLKVDILKAIEMTESEIDSLETKLKSLPGDDEIDILSEEQGTVSNFTTTPAPLQVVSSGDTIVKNVPTAVEERHVGLKDDEIDSPSSATSKFVEETFPSEAAVGFEGFSNSDASDSSDLEDKYLKNDTSVEENTFLQDDRNPVVINYQDVSGVRNVHSDVHETFLSIYASNKDAFNEASEVLNKLLPAQPCLSTISPVSSVSSLQRDSSVMKELISKRKRSLQLKEKVITVKFKTFQHFWKEGRIVSLRKLRVKSHKKFDLSRSVYKKNRSSSRSRITFSVGSSQTVPAEEVIEFVNGLLSESSFKPCRNTLKMPTLILEKETMMSRFISNNGRVEDPCAAEKERSTCFQWMAEDREVFIEKLAIFGKDFKKISSFLQNKTVADCVEFYYKNHKSEWFEKARKKLGCAKQRRSQPNTYLVASGKRGLNREANAASLDILGAVAANNDDGGQNPQKSTSKISFGASSSYKPLPRNDDSLLQRSNSLDMSSSETVAADVLAGICGTLSSEAMSSCITTSVDPTEGYHHDWRSQRVGSYTKRPLTPDVTQIVVEDDEYSDESCGEMLDYTDWTDHEKSIFINAVSSYGKDFVMISEHVGTRSRDQCKIFFSKSRKSLGLDRIMPRASNGADCNGGDDSDIEDGCAVEIGSDSVTSNEEDLHSPETKLGNESDVLATEHNLKPEFKMLEENNGNCPDNGMPDESVLKSSLSGDTHVDDEPVRDNGECASAQGVEAMVVSSNTESVGVEDENDKSPLNGSSEAGNNALVEVSGSEENDGQEFLNKKVEYRDNANSSEVPLVGNVSSVVDSSGLHYLEKPRAISLGHNGLLASMDSSSLFSVPIKYQEHSSSNGLLSVGVNGINDRQPQKIVMTGDRLPVHSLSNRVESSQILRGYPVSVQTVKEINAEVDYRKSVPMNLNNREPNLQLNQHPEFFLQKCNGSGHQTRAIESYPFQEQRREHSRTQSGCLSDMDRPSRNGDVKLFGKILVSSQEKSSCSRSDDSQHHKVNLDSPKLKFDYNNYLGSENIPVRNSSFWDGSGSQTAFPSLPLDSSLLLSKYPTAFSSNPIPAVKLVQPFSLDMKQQHSQDVLFSEMQRRNGFNVVSALQQGRINVVGRNGVLVGGQCSGVSDPVAAIKMHYANAENFSMQMKEDDKWRSNGDIGR